MDLALGTYIMSEPAFPPLKRKVNLRVTFQRCGCSSSAAPSPLPSEGSGVPEGALREDPKSAQVRCPGTRPNPREPHSGCSALSRCSRSGNGSAPRTPDSALQAAILPSSVHLDCSPPQSPVISTLTPSWPSGDCPKTERHTPGPNALSVASGFCDAPKQGEKQESGIGQPHSPAGLQNPPEAPVLTLQAGFPTFPVFPLNPKPQTHPDVSLPQRGRVT